MIILGAARSGTKFLRDTLGASKDLAPTPYDLNYVWRTGNENHLDDALPRSLCREDIRNRIRRELDKAAGLRSPNDPRRLIEKTVSNTVRVPFVDKVYPDADYVHLIRDGRNVVESSLRQWHARPDWRYLLGKARTFPLRNYRYALWYFRSRLVGGSYGTPAKIWGVRYPGLADDVAHSSIPSVCARQWVNSVSSVRRSREEGFMSRYVEIRYEELIADERALGMLIDWLKLSDSQDVLAYYRRELRVPKETDWSRTLSHEERTSVLAELEPMLRTLKYL